MRSSRGEWITSDEPIEPKTTTLSSEWEPMGYLPPEAWPEPVELYSGIQSDSIEAAVAGQKVSDRTLWRARQKRPDDMALTEAMFQFGSFRQRVALGMP